MKDGEIDSRGGGLTDPGPRRQRRFSQGSAAARRIGAAAQHFLERNCQPGRVLCHRLLEEFIQRAAGPGVLLHLCVPNELLALIEPLCQAPKLFSRKLLDGFLDCGQCVHDRDPMFAVAGAQI